MTQATTKENQPVHDMNGFESKRAKTNHHRLLRCASVRSSMAGRAAIVDRLAEDGAGGRSRKTSGSVPSLAQSEQSLVRRKGLILITFAWMVEIVGMVAGFVNAIVTTYPDGELPQRKWLWLWALPMGMIAVAELGRIPLTSVLFHRHLRTRVMAFFGIVFLAGLAFENWTFGFERVVQLRLDPVSKAERAFTKANNTLLDLEKQAQNVNNRNDSHRDQLDHELTNIQSRIEIEQTNHGKEIQQLIDSCNNTIYHYKCLQSIIPQQNQENQRFDRNIKSLYERRDELQQKRNNDDPDNSKNETDLAKARNAVSNARNLLNKQKNNNQIYRLAAMWYRIDTTKVNAEQFNNARFLFTTFSAFALALVGTVSAFVYYARQRVPGELLSSRLFGKLWQARRAYYVRKRRPIYRDVPVEKIVYRDGKEIVEVEKEVPRWIDRIVLIPRWGIKTPIHVNSLIRNERLNGNASDGRVGDGEDGRVGNGEGELAMEKMED